MGGGQLCHPSSSHAGHATSPTNETETGSHHPHPHGGVMPAGPTVSLPEGACAHAADQPVMETGAAEDCSSDDEAGAPTRATDQPGRSTCQRDAAEADPGSEAQRQPLTNQLEAQCAEAKKGSTPPRRGPHQERELRSYTLSRRPHMTNHGPLTTLGWYPTHRRFAYWQVPRRISSTQRVSQ